MNGPGIAVRLGTLLAGVGVLPRPPPPPPPHGFQGLPGAHASSSRRLRVRFGSTGMPGPVFVETVTFLT